MNDIIQGASVGIILIIAIVWIIRRIQRKGGNQCDCGCGGCNLKDKCQNNSKNK